MLQIEESGVVYRNPAPGVRAIHAALPFAGKLSEKEILHFHRRGRGFVSADGNLASSRSTDGGNTGSDEGLVYDRRDDDRHYEYRGGAFRVLADGALLLAATRFERPDPDDPLYNPKTDGYRRTETVLSYSRDTAHRWSAPQVVTYPPRVLGNLSHGLRRSNVGRWMHPIET